MQELLLNQWFVGGVTAIVSGISGYLVSRVNKAPDVQTSLNAAVAGITAHYQTALTASTEQTAAMRAEIVSLQRSVEAQSAVIADLEQHINDLVEAMNRAGVSPPPRVKRKSAKE